jgi:hypothetical protein
MTRKAVCCCGKCAIEVEGDPLTNGICHCKNCKKRTGTAFGWSAYFADAQIKSKTGDLKTYEITGTNHAHRYFCTNCGTTLYWIVVSMPNLTGIAGGCFADNPLPPPSFSASDTGRCAWLKLPDDWGFMP